jgi:hypothetical protein
MTLVLLEFKTEIPRRELQALIPPGVSATTLDPLANPAMSACPQPLTEQAAYWMNELGCDGGPLLVVAYCSGAVLAEVLTAAWPGPAAAVLIDPVSIGPLEPQTLLSELATSLDPEIDWQRIPAVSGLPAEESFRRALEFLRALVDAVAPELPAHIAESLVAKHISWFSYGLAASQASEVSGKSRVLLSEGMPLPTAWREGHVEHCRISQAELLDSQAARDAVRGAAAALDGAPAER